MSAHISVYSTSKRNATDFMVEYKEVDDSLLGPIHRPIATKIKRQDQSGPPPDQKGPPADQKGPPAPPDAAPPDAEPVSLTASTKNLNGGSLSMSENTSS